MTEDIRLGSRGVEVGRREMRRAGASGPRTTPPCRGSGRPSVAGECGPGRRSMHPTDSAGDIRTNHAGENPGAEPAVSVCTVVDGAPNRPGSPAASQPTT